MGLRKVKKASVSRSPVKRRENNQIIRPNGCVLMSDVVHGFKGALLYFSVFSFSYCALHIFLCMYGWQSYNTTKLPQGGVNVPQMRNGAVSRQRSN